MLAIGFDPAFIDTIVRAETREGNLIENLPDPGNHHRITNISRVAGGNAVNIAYVMKKLGNDFHLVIPSNPLFDELLHQKGLSCDYRIHEIINETVAVAWKPGEIQFNSVMGDITEEHFTEELYQYWINSPIKISVNWGLNYGSPSWLSCLWLSSCGWSFEEIDEVEDVVAFAKEETDLKGKLVLEPGSIKEHPEREDLMDLLSTISQSSFDSLYPVFSCNEEENQEYQDLNFRSKLLHTSNKVECIVGTNRQVIEVPKIENIETFVGAGDSFLAGIIDRLLNKNKLDPVYAISIAQQYMTGTL